MISPPPVVFISYASPDVEIGRAIERKLGTVPIPAWLAPSALAGGTDFSVEIERAIATAKVFVLVLSPASAASPWVQKEALAAVARVGMHILPLQVEAFELDGWAKHLLRNVQVVRATDGELSSRIDALVVRIREILCIEGGSPPPRPPPDLRITVDALPPLWVGDGAALDVSLTHEGGQGPVRWLARGLPEGLELAVANPETGRTHLRGAPKDRRREHAAIRFDLEDEQGGAVSLPFPVPLRFARREEYREVAGGRFPAGCPAGRSRLASLAARFNALAPALRGAAASLDALTKRYPAREIDVPTFYLKTTPVTNAEYREFVRATGHRLPTHWTDATTMFDQDLADHPVVNVSWGDAMAYCAWRGTRLPTASEWEKAARGVDGKLYPWGDAWSPHYCNGLEGKRRATSAVFDHDDAASDYGVLDLAGNVAEWTDAGRVLVDAHGICLVHRTVRGGSFADPCEVFGLGFVESREDMSTAIVFDPTGQAVPVEAPRHPWIGFRDVLDVPRPVPSQEVVLIPGGASIEGSAAGARSFVVDDFAMSRFAVSNLEYLSFVGATEHCSPAHWTGRSFPYEERHHPVVNVSVQDARAFCDWKGKSGPRHALPTVAQWIRAVRGLSQGTAVRDFPWEGPYEPWRCNSADSNVGHALPVFALPEGTTPEGLHQLCGNVFEWTRSADCRGGSWRSPPYPRGAAPWVGVSNPQRLDGDTGFRYVTIASAARPSALGGTT